MVLVSQDAMAQLVQIADLQVSLVVLLGFSFILGSLFTVFVLLILELMRASRVSRAERSGGDE